MAAKEILYLSRQDVEDLALDIGAIIEAIDQMFRLSIGESSFTQLLPLSSVRYIPLFEPAYTTLGLFGSTANALICDSPGKSPILLQFAPPSAL